MSADLALAAEALIGTPFRLHGRDTARGLDCVGLVAAALEAVGRAAVVPAGYRLRHLDLARFAGAARAAGLVETAGAIAAGDVLLLRPAPGQWHLALAATRGGIVHAHAGLGRVVLTPPPLIWPVERHWRLVS